jgi:hypothetical protein
MPTLVNSQLMLRMFFSSLAAHLLLKKPKARTLKVLSTLTDLLTAPSLDVSL